MVNPTFGSREIRLKLSKRATESVCTNLGSDIVIDYCFIFIFIKYKVFVKHIENFCHTPFFFSVFLFGPPIVLLLLLCVSNCPEIYCNKSSIPATEYTQILELQDI